MIAAAVSAAGLGAAVHYARAGLTLSHYDARAHLVVARRIIDSLTPGWQQIGAVWLPLPHLLNMVPVQIDALYRTGASGVFISIASMALAAWAMASMILRTTGSASGAMTAAALLMGNPDVLYLQSTPMSEPLLFATVLLSIELTARWLDGGALGWPAAAGGAITCACLTRYEAWPISGALVGLSGVVLLRRNTSLSRTIVACARLAAYPVITAVFFMANSRWTVGEWFVSSGFFVPENVEALGHPVAAMQQLNEGLFKMSGDVLVWAGYGGTLAAALAWWRGRGRESLVLLVALVGAGAVPWYAYLHGHPFRIRYDVPLVAAAAALGGVAVSLLWSRAQPLVAAALIAGTMLQAHPLDPGAPMVIEAQRDAANMTGRRAVTAYLDAHYDGRLIMMSMGSLAHYMQDLSAEGFALRDFLHEGNGDLWSFALLRADGMVGWIAIEEKAEGGDALFVEAQHNHHFLEGFTRVAEGGGVALYRSTRNGK